MRVHLTCSAFLQDARCPVSSLVFGGLSARFPPRKGGGGLSMERKHQLGQCFTVGVSVSTEEARAPAKCSAAGS